MAGNARSEEEGEAQPSTEGVRALADLCRRAGVHELEASVGAWSIRMLLDFDAAMPQALPEPRDATNAPAAPSILRSEWVGVFHRALDAESAPLVHEGQQIRDGDVIGLIEAMQLLHEQRTDREGTVSRFLVEEGAPVEFGQPLLEID